MTKFGKLLTKKLNQKYFIGNDVVQSAYDFIGRVLVTNIDGKLTKGVIVETEAYRGYSDKASHTNNGKRTKRNEVMYANGGRAYVYLCYGIHSLFNIVTNVEGKADAVLVRALYPVAGEINIVERFHKKGRLLSNGPGILTKAMGIDLGMTNEELGGNLIWIETGVAQREKLKICVSKRVGVDYAEEDANLPWRFYLDGDKHVSKT